GPSRTHSLPLSRALYDGINSWAQSHRGTAYHVILGVLTLLFLDSRQGGEMVVGIPVHHRSSRFRDTPGMLVDINPLRITLDPERAFIHLLGEMIQEMRSSFRHKRFPVGEIARLAGIRGGRQRLFDIVLTHDRWDLTVAFDGVPASADRHFPGSLSHALLVTILENHPDQDLELLFEFNTTVFDPDEMPLLIRRTKHILEQVMAQPEQPVRSLSLLPPEERQRVLDGFNPSPVTESEWLAVHRVFQEQAERTPDAEALCWNGGSMTYGALERAANRLARHLRNSGVAAEGMVGLCLRRGPEMIVAVLAILKAGGAYLPLDPDHPPERSRIILTEAEVGLVVTSSELAESVSQDGVAAVILESGSDPWPQGDDTPLDDTPIDADTLAYVIHTSGSTGIPKGVMVGHRPLALRIDWMARAFAMERRDRVRQFFRLAFDPSAHEIFLPLTTGATLVLTDPGRQSATALLDLMESQRITIASLVPTMLDALLPHRDGRDLSAPRIVTSGGEGLSAPLAERARGQLGCRLLNFYGPTEATILCSSWEGDPSEEQGVLPLGRPLDATTLYVLDHLGNPLPVGREGEICIGGEALARGYLNHPEQTRERFVADPFSERDGAMMFRTGDRGVWRADGQLLFRGRQDHQIKLRGYRIELGEIESALRLHPDIHEAVVGLHRPSQGELFLVAWITAAPGRSLHTEPMRGFLAQRLADYMIPTVFMVLDRLPTGANGKIDKDRLPPPSRQDAGHTGSQAPPVTESEQAIHVLWQSVLKQGDYGIDDDFFIVGGDSLSAMTLLAAIDSRFGVKIPLDTLFAGPTVRTMARTLEQQRMDIGSGQQTLASRGGHPDEIGHHSSCVVLTPIRHDIDQNPLLFCVASSLRDRTRLGRVAAAMGDRQPFYLLQPPGTWPEGRELTMDLLAEDYAELLVSLLPDDGRFRIAGYSVGGSVCVALAAKLLDRKVEPGPPIMLDTIYPTLIGLYVWGYRLLSRLVGLLPVRLPYAHRFGDAGLLVQLTALSRSTPKPFPGPVVLIQGAWVSGTTWKLFGRSRRIFPHGLITSKVGGGHGGMTRGRFLPRLARRLEETLCR
ncbi:MAG: amino acid adenylation domain-containing protein, partial [Magnetococcales bacterium]|nr:amino acid adenylation domain-containing protein [Magnetococcales bacterium]